MSTARWLASLACAAALAGIPVAQADRMSGQRKDDGGWDMAGMMGDQGMMGSGMGTMGCRDMMGGQGMMDGGHGTMGGQGMMGGHGTIGPVMGSGMTGDRMTGGRDMPNLDLSDTQRAQIDKIRTEARKQQLDLGREMRSEQRKLQALYAADKLDRGAIDAQRRKIQGLQLQMIQSNMTAHNDVEDVLTDAQREQLHARRHG